MQIERKASDQRSRLCPQAPIHRDPAEDFETHGNNLISKPDGQAIRVY